MENLEKEENLLKASLLMQDKIANTGEVGVRDKCVGIKRKG